VPHLSSRDTCGPAAPCCATDGCHATNNPAQAALARVLGGTTSRQINNTTLFLPCVSCFATIKISLQSETAADVSSWLRLLLTLRVHLWTHRCLFSSPRVRLVLKQFPLIVCFYPVTVRAILPLAMVRKHAALSVALLLGVLAATQALPDLILDANRLAASISIGTYYFTAQSCAYQEGCVTGTGNRRLLRFDTATPNIGTSDLHIGAPNSLFEYDPCHGHYHYKGYAEYRMYQVNTNVEVTRGRKQAFCLMDSTPYAGYTGNQRGNGGHHCGNQGISVGWQDVYYSGCKSLLRCVG